MNIVHCRPMITRVEAALGWAVAVVFALSGQARAMALKSPAEITLSCDQVIDTSKSGMPEALGGCGGTTFTFADSVLRQVSEREYIVRRAWNAADTCGNTAVCAQLIHVVPARVRVAVLALENLAGSEEGARAFARLLENEIARDSRFEGVPAGDVETALLRARVRVPMLMDQEQRAHLAQLLNADYFVLGSILTYQTYDDPYSGPVPIISVALQLWPAGQERAAWSETLHAAGNAGEWLFGLGVDHDITHLAKGLARKSLVRVERAITGKPCPAPFENIR